MKCLLDDTSLAYVKAGNYSVTMGLWWDRAIMSNPKTS